MNLKKYEAFYQTASLGSVTAAAKALGCSQSALSHLLQDFEADLGFPLLTKNRAGAKLTRQGELLLPEVKALLKQVEKVTALSESIRANQAGTIRIATYDEFYARMPPSLGQKEAEPVERTVDGKTVAAVDCLVPGIGEIIGGSQREDNYDALLARMNELGPKPEDYGFYLDLRKYGSTRHAGFGLGFERCVMYLTGIGNIRDAIPFPRTVKNCEL